MLEKLIKFVQEKKINSLHLDAMYYIAIAQSDLTKQRDADPTVEGIHDYLLAHNEAYQQTFSKFAQKNKDRAIKELLNKANFIKNHLLGMGASEEYEKRAEMEVELASQNLPAFSAQQIKRKLEWLMLDKATFTIIKKLVDLKIVESVSDGKITFPENPAAYYRIHPKHKKEVGDFLKNIGYEM